MATDLNIESWRCNNAAVQFLAVLFVFLSACSSLWESKVIRSGSSSRSKVNKDLQVRSETQAQALRLVSEMDSTQKQVIAEIVPIGRFRYSAADGYRGRAQSVLVNEQLRAGRQRRELLAEVQQSRLDSTSIESAAELSRSRTREKVREPPNLSWLYLAGCAALFIIIYRFRKYLAA